MWFLLDDGELKLSLNTSRHKTKNLSSRPQCSLLIVDLQNPYRYLESAAARTSIPTTTMRSRARSERSTAAPT